jgi:hypothetical protein
MSKKHPHQEKTCLPTNGSSSDGNLNSESKEKVRVLINASDKNEISELRSDVDELSNEVLTAVVDLKKSIADIRSSVSEMENPFNLLRTGSGEKDAEKQSERLPGGVKSLIIGKPEEKPIDEKELIPQKPEPTPIPIPIPISQTEAPTKEKPIVTVQSLTPSKSIRPSAYIDWIWDLLDAGLTAENIRQLATLSELMNYLPTRTSELIYSLAVTAEKIRLIGFTKGHLLLFLYKAASISKTNIDPEDMAALIDLTEQQLKNPQEE